MPLGVREVLLLIRARDQATRILADIGRQFGTLSGQAQAAALSSIKHGAAVLGIGVAMSAVGAAGIEFYKNAVDAAMDYNLQSALTLTQVDQLGVSLEDIKAIGRDVAKAIPAPFEEMQSSLYDIFSSMDVNTSQAEVLLEGFSRAAVAGQVGVQDAGRATIAILNAFKIPVEDVNRVLDIQFETVRKGVLTYDELASTIGRAIPSAQRAGQSVETVGTMMAFLTRNGQSAAQAATASARAFDLLSNPKFAQHMHDFGIEVFDAEGKFRPMLDIVTELRYKLAAMTPEERTQELADLTKGAGGTIQAMRFLNTAVNDTNGMFGSLFESINGASGSLDAAYDIMFNQPATQAQLLKNNISVLMTEIGDEVLPVVGHAVQFFLGLVEAFQSLDPRVKQAIIWFGLIASVFMLVMGITVSLIGALMILHGVLALLGVSLGTVAAVVGGIMAALILLGVGIGLVVKGFQDGIVWMQALGAAIIAGLVPIWGGFVALGLLIINNWDKIKSATSTMWNLLQQFIGWLVATAINVWGHVTDAAVKAWGALLDVTETVWSALQTGAEIAGEVVGAALELIASLAEMVVGAFQTVWDYINQFWQWFAETFGPGFMEVFGAVRDFFVTVGGEIGETLASLVSRLQWFIDLLSNLGGPLEEIANAIHAAIDIIIQVIQAGMEVVQIILTTAWNMIVHGIIAPMLGTFILIVTTAWNMLWQATTSTWDLLVIIIQTAVQLVRTIIETAVGIIVAIWSNFNEVVTDITSALWDSITSIVSTAINLVRDIINIALNIIQGDWGEAWDAIKDFFIDAWNGIWEGLQATWALIQAFFVALPQAIVGFVGDLTTLLLSKGVDIINSLWNGISSMIAWMVTQVATIKDWVVGGVGDLSHILWDAAVALVVGFWQGIESMGSWLWGKVTGFFGSIKDTVLGVFDVSSPSKVFRWIGQMLTEGLALGLSDGTIVAQNAAAAMAESVAQTAEQKAAEAFGDAVKRVQDNAFTLGLISTEEYMSILQHRLEGLVTLSDEWTSVVQQLDSLAEQSADAAAKIAAEHMAIQDNMFEIGALGTAEYLEMLRQRLAALEQYSDEWVQVYQQIQTIQEDVAREHMAIHDVMFEVGDLNTDQYLEMLQTRLDATEKYSEEWYRIWQQIMQIQDDVAQQEMDAAQKASDMLTVMYQVGDIGPNTYLVELEAQLAGLEKYSTEWKRVYDTIQDVKAGIAAANLDKPFQDMADAIGVPVDKLHDFANRVQEAVNQIADAATSALPTVAQIMNDATKDGVPNLGDFSKGLDEQMKSMTEFTGNVQSLMDAGLLNAAKLAIEQGPEVAKALAEGISSGKTEQIDAQLNTFNEMTKQIGDIAREDWGPSIVEGLGDSARIAGEVFGTNMRDGLLDFLLGDEFQAGLAAAAQSAADAFSQALDTQPPPEVPGSDGPWRSGAGSGYGGVRMDIHEGAIKVEGGGRDAEAIAEEVVSKFEELATELVVRPGRYR